MVSTITNSSIGQENGTFPHREFRGVWIATVNNIDWPSRKGLSVPEQQQELIALFDLATSLRLNAVIFQVRPAGDAFYDSKLEPWSVWLTGIQGQAPDPYYDPLEFAVTESHKRGLELHAWFNPYRAGFTSQTAFAANHVSKTHPELVYKYGNNFWMDPGEPVIKEHTVNVILDVVRRYDIDGVHFDDYFYPYAVESVAFPDTASYSKYTSAGGTLSLDDWRRDNVNSMVQQVYLGILKEKPWVKFGISPFGIWQPGNPPGITGLNAYATLYADSRKWLQEGWVDYLTPQLYWRINSRGQSYPKLLSWWLQENTQNRHIYPGNIFGGGGGGFGSRTTYRSRTTFSARTGVVDRTNISAETTAASETTLSADTTLSAGTTLSGGTAVSPNVEIINQVAITRDLRALGNVFFSIKGLVRSRSNLQDDFKQKIYPQQALVPMMAWKRSYFPQPPDKATVTRKDATTIQIQWEPTKPVSSPGHESESDPKSLWRWAIYRQSGNTGWELIAVVPGSQTIFIDTLPAGNQKKTETSAKIQYAISALDRISNESKPLIASLNQ